MKTAYRFLLLGIMLMYQSVAVASVATTVGSNLTAYNPGSMNNNNWNNLMNNRAGGSAPVADFGNCNALILRCAQPKCARGGCTSMDITRPIVSGCIQSNAGCSKYGADLTEYIAAQLVAISTAKVNQQAAQAQAAAAAAANQQTNAQMQQMQVQMQQMQNQMAQQNAETVAQLQAALAEQQAAVAAASAASAKPTTTTVTSNTAVSDAQEIAAQSGVSADLLAREQISGQILSSIENAEMNMKTLKATMEDVFTYAGCDTRGNNCLGPKRVKAFKDKALKFFDPYNDVLGEVYDALVIAQSVGVDITDIYMLLNNTCNQWGQYMCSSATNSTTVGGVQMYRWPRYDNKTCPGGRSLGGQTKDGGVVRGGHECIAGQTVPPQDDASCTLLNAIKQSEDETVKREYLFAIQGDFGDNVRVGCVSSVLDSSPLFRNMKKQSKIDIEILQRIIDQDSPPTSWRRDKNYIDMEEVKYCALTETGYENLHKYSSMRSLPTRDICVNENTLDKSLHDAIFLQQSDTVLQMAQESCEQKENAVFSPLTRGCYVCEQNETGCDAESKKTKAEEKYCADKFYGATMTGGKCDCSNVSDLDERDKCQERFGQRCDKNLFQQWVRLRKDKNNKSTHLTLEDKKYCMVNKNKFWI